jgi:pimeloyl-ACP methyl ester carboxylesterase
MTLNIGTVALALAALFVRGGGALGETERSRWADASAWILRAGGAWLFASAWGAWTPLWIGGMLAVAIAAVASIPGLARWRGSLRTGADALVVFTCAALSVPPFSWAGAVSAAAAFAALGFVVDRWLTPPRRDAAADETIARPAHAPVAASPAAPTATMQRNGMLLRSSLIVLVLGTGVAGTGWLAGRTAETTHGWLGNWTHFAIGPVQPGRRLELPTGAVAWLHRPSGGAEGPRPAALLFHGMDPAGVRQKAAEALRRGLLDAGFVVLSVDHPGFGASPPPDPEAGLRAWDPLPNAEAALNRLRDVPNVGPIIAVGHSMGCSQVLRLIRKRGDAIRLAAVFGSAAPDPPQRDAYWYRRFHEDRGLEREQLSKEKWRRISDTYYNDLAAARALPPDHPPIRFVEFGLEHPNITASRDLVYRAIPGRKQRWRLPLANHYFCAQEMSSLNLVVGNAEIAQRLGQRLRDGLRRVSQR